MQITTTQADDVTVLRIGGDLRIAAVADAKAELVAMLATGRAIRVDLSELGECDTAGIQLLLMACASARATGKIFATIGHTAAFLAASSVSAFPWRVWTPRQPHPATSTTIGAADDPGRVRPAAGMNLLEQEDE